MAHHRKIPRQENANSWAKGACIPLPTFLIVLNLSLVRTKQAGISAVYVLVCELKPEGNLNSECSMFQLHLSLGVNICMRCQNALHYIALCSTMRGKSATGPLGHRRHNIAFVRVQYVCMQDTINQISKLPAEKKTKHNITVARRHTCLVGRLTTEKIQHARLTRLHARTPTRHQTCCEKRKNTHAHAYTPAVVHCGVDGHNAFTKVAPVARRGSPRHCQAVPAWTRKRARAVRR